MFSSKILIAKKNRHHVVNWCVNSLPAAFLKPTEKPDVSQYLCSPWTTLPFVRIFKMFCVWYHSTCDSRSVHWYAIVLPALLPLSGTYICLNVAVNLPQQPTCRLNHIHDCAITKFIPIIWWIMLTFMNNYHLKSWFLRLFSCKESDLDGQDRQT